MAGPKTGCGCMTSQTGCLVIGWLEVILLFPVITAGILLIVAGAVGIPAVDELLEGGTEAQGRYRQSMELIGAVVLTIALVYLFAPCCLIHGASRGKPAYVMAYGVCAVLRSIASLAWFGLLIDSGAPGAVVGTVVAALAIQVYITYVVICHYNYISERREYDNELLNMSTQKSTAFSM